MDHYPNSGGLRVTFPTRMHSLARESRDFSKGAEAHLNVYWVAHSMSKTYIEVGALIVALIVLLLLIVFIQNPIALIINSLIAIGILFLLNAIFGLGIPINIVTILVVAIGGIVGLLLIIILRLTRIAFV